MLNKRIGLAALLSLLFLAPGSRAGAPFFVSDTVAVVQNDSLAKARALADSLLRERDTTRMSTPSLVGSLDRSLPPDEYRTRQALLWHDYRSAGGMLAELPGILIREQSSEGQYSGLNVRGVDWRSVAVLSNGRPLNDPASGIFNLYGFSTEYADRVEVITGPRAFLYGLNSTGGAVNFVTKNYNSNKAYSKLVYSESAYNYLFSDGTFSQNVSRRVNVTFGFQHRGTDGRYAGSNDNTWLMRAKIRYQPLPRINVIVSEFFTSANADLNGGVDYANTQSGYAFDPVYAVMRNTDAYEKITRHDVDLSVVGTLLGDTVNVSTLTFYYSNNLREYRDEENRSRPNGLFLQSDHRSSWAGLQFSQNLDTPWERLSFGGTVELRQVEGSPNIGRRRETIASVWGKQEFLLPDNLTVAGFARYDRYLAKNFAGIGGDVRWKIAPGIELFGGMSLSRRMPNFTELYWADSVARQIGTIQAEQHRSAEAGAIFSSEKFGSVRLAYFHRTVDDPILAIESSSPGIPPPLFYNGGRVATNGVEGAFSLRLWFLTLEGTALLTRQQDGGGNAVQEYPSFAATGGVYYWDKVFKEKLEIKGGIRTRMNGAYQGSRFNAESLTYTELPSSLTGPRTSSSIDFFLIAHIGDAYIHFMMDNFAGIKYFGTPFYPGYDRAVRIAIEWEFLN